MRNSLFLCVRSEMSRMRLFLLLPSIKTKQKTFFRVLMIFFGGWKNIFFPFQSFKRSSSLWMKTVATDCHFFVPAPPPLPPAASSVGPNVTLRAQYHCYQGPAIPVDRLCDFTRDCPRGDDEGDLCREYTVTSEPENHRPSRLCICLDPKKHLLKNQTPRPGQPC